MATSDELKALGNKAIAAKNFDEAVEHFTAAIAIDPENHILYSNRSAAYASKRDWDHAFADAEKTTQLKPDWPKGWGRLGSALYGKRDLVRAYEAYQEGLKLDPNNKGMKTDLDNVERAMDAELRDGGRAGDGSSFPPSNAADEMGGMFKDPALLGKLAANPKTAAYLRDPTFMQRLQAIQANPSNVQDIFSDPRMIEVMGVAMGLDLSMAGMPGAAGGPEAADAPTASAGAAAGAAAAAASSTAPKAEEKVEGVVEEPEAPEEEDEEAKAKRAAKEEADKEKALGTASYKKRDFDDAIAHYQKAWELHKDIVYLNNLGAAQFEKGDYEAAIAACTQAVEEGRALLADWKTMAKSYARIGTAHERLGQLDQAIDNYNKSLREQRTPDVVAKLRAAERRRIDEAKQAYIDPAKAEAAREEGNRKFKETDWPGAVQCYTEMIRRAPTDPRGYSNRAAAYAKLLELPSALDDCDAAIKHDPTFVRAYIRKAQTYFGMRKYSDCVDACAEADRVDKEFHNGANAREIDQQQQKALAAMYSARDNETEEQTRERIANDPDIMGIMQDPVMQAILQQAQGDPAALNEHMRNPSVRTKIQKLIAAGVIRVGR
ncbi:stress-induced-phosphoprotein 1 [Sporothrix brasiliensis 5110]|uniref:Stress-induced-phosphoprotein 1 n=1 Tax=Sporothrix brasiliensis 5110 TaxID=1398154 RepID=A0A0C2J0E8_9PEZI|nr:stress-induced-phosphoprotein 1 [Sporothrix brasiliensis 5110]KIH94846.1 stress-induced-phosphoprotein 1 [Sporothrix brasiliensis 5110]